MPLRFPRPVMALIVSGTAAISIGLSAMPTFAGQAPSANRAGAGALPRRYPAAPPPASADGIGTQMLRAVEISAALLIFLLLLVAVYWMIGRRGRSSQLAVTTEWAHRQAQSRYPHGASDADKMLELFAVPPAAPAPPVALGAPSAQAGLYGPRSARGESSQASGGGVFAPAASRGSGERSSRQPGEFAADEPNVGGASDGRWVSHGPASRAVNRPAPVSGAPPWEPASAPEGELPWAASPGRHSAAGPGRSSGAAPADGYGRDHQTPDPRTWGSTARAARASEPTTFEPLPSFEPPSFEPSPPAYGAGGYQPTSGYGVPASPRSFSGYDPPARPGAHGDFDFRPEAPGVASHPEAPQAPRVASSGLPVRQPQADRAPSPSPLSPSGSLWEPVSRDPGAGEPMDYGDQPTDYRDLKYDSAGRPIFSWDQPAGRQPRPIRSED